MAGASAAVARTKEAKRDLQDTAVRAAGWTIAAGLLARALGVLGSLCLTYFLDPDAIGDVHVAAILCSTANQFTLLGYGQYLVAKPDAGSDVVYHVAVLHLALGVLAFAGILALCGPLSHWLHAPTLTRYLPWMVGAFLLERLYFVPERVLIRELAFPKVAVARSTAELTYTVSSVAFAVAGLGRMSIIFGNIARSAVRLFMMWRYVPRAAWLTRAPLQMAVYRRVLRFGLPLGASQALAFANTRFDNLLMKRLFGSAVMGRYTLAYNLADVPAGQIGEQIAEVLLPSLARMTPEDRRRAIVRVTGLVALIVFPMASGFGAVALTAERLMRDKWIGVGSMLMVLSVMSVTRPLCSKAHSYLQATDRTVRITQLEGFKLVAVLGCMYALSRFGPLGSCFGMGAAFLLELSLSWVIMSRADGIPISAFIGRVVPPLLACAPMIAAVEVTRRALLALPSEKPYVLLALVVQVLVGVVVYAAGAFTLARRQTRELLSLVRGARRRREAREVRRLPRDRRLPLQEHRARAHGVQPDAIPRRALQRRRVLHERVLAGALHGRRDVRLVQRAERARRLKLHVQPPRRQANPRRGLSRQRLRHAHELDGSPPRAGLQARLQPGGLRHVGRARAHLVLPSALLCRVAFAGRPRRRGLRRRVRPPPGQFRRRKGLPVVCLPRDRGERVRPPHDLRPRTARRDP